MPSNAPDPTFAATVDEVARSVYTFNANAREHLDLAVKLMRGTRYWAHDSLSDLFGPSKFVAFGGMTFARYDDLRRRQRLARVPRFDGSSTRERIETLVRGNYEDTAAMPELLRRWGLHLTGADPFRGVDASKWRFIDLGGHAAGVLEPETLDRLASVLRDCGASGTQGNPTPLARRVEVTRYERSPAVVAEVLEAAAGTCELCESPAPFVTAEGRWFLEVHHVVTLADDGPDTVDNAVAVCPNCHRALHHARDRDHLVDQLYATVPRLVRHQQGRAA